MVLGDYMKKLTIILASGLLISNLATSAFAVATVSDDALKTAVTTVIDSNKSFSNVTVTTKNGSVTLAGTVTSQQQYQDAESMVRKTIEGMKDINGNEVQMTNSIQILSNI